jgi:hypothetical protein
LKEIFRPKVQQLEQFRIFHRENIMIRVSRGILKVLKTKGLFDWACGLDEGQKE